MSRRRICGEAEEGDEEEKGEGEEEKEAKRYASKTVKNKFSVSTNRILSCLKKKMPLV